MAGSDNQPVTGLRPDRMQHFDVHVVDVRFHCRSGKGGRQPFPNDNRSSDKRQRLPDCGADASGPRLRGDFKVTNRRHAPGRVAVGCNVKRRKAKEWQCVALWSCWR
jgi:hypothetical protein